MSDHVHSKNFYPGSELERQTSSQSVFNLPEIIEDIQTSANDPTHEGRTRVLIDSPDHITIVSGYQPGEGEALHAHPTRNTLGAPRDVSRHDGGIRPWAAASSTSQGRPRGAVYCNGVHRRGNAHQRAWLQCAG